MNENSLTDWLMKIVNVTGLDQDAATGAITAYTPAAQSSLPESDPNITGFEALVLDYAVPFPLSLVVSRVTLTRYQLLFRYLLSLRHLETSLIHAWTDHSKVLTWRHRGSNPRIERAKRKAWTLRARMLNFVQQLIYYSTAEVIEPNWQGLMGRLKMGEAGEKADKDEDLGVKRTADELMQDHVDFLATCLKECMLTNAKLLKVSTG
jgi:gamma-tubulin complex component 2